MQNALQGEKPRYHLIDSLRGLALVNMAAFHLCYDLFIIFGLDGGWFFQPLTVVWERFICVSFILISGVSFNFSHSAYRRGIVLNLFGFAVTAVTALFLPEQAVWFGILNLLGCSMLLLEPLRIYLERLTPAVGFCASMLLYTFTYGVPQRFVGFFSVRLFDLPDALYSCKWLSFLGLKSSDFHSTDYFPIIPWMFLFASGYFLWRFIKNRGFDGFFMLRIPVLNTIGRYSLWIYLVHQPMIMGILMLVMPK